MISLVVFGRPGPQGSKRHVGNGRMIESSAEAVASWREAVRAEAVTARGDQAPLDGPLVVDIVFTMLRPVGHYRTGKNGHLLRDDAPARPTGRPDLSKLVRSTEDALVDAGLLRDDSRVVEYGRLAKVYAGSDPDALNSSGAVIRVRSLREWVASG